MSKQLGKHIPMKTENILIVLMTTDDILTVAKTPLSEVSLEIDGGEMKIAILRDVKGGRLGHSSFCASPLTTSSTAAERQVF